MDEQLFSLIGRLYVEVLNSQKVIELLQNKIKDYESQTQDGFDNSEDINEQ
jgi:hypothetical protein